MQMEGRFRNTPAYRYGFNGKEKDPETSGEGNQYDYGFRIYNPRIARFLSVDPLTKDYPWYTPYQFAGNTPIQAKDLDGLEPEYMIDKNGKLTKPMIQLLSTAFGYCDDYFIKSTWIASKKNELTKQELFAYVRRINKDIVHYDPAYKELNDIDKINVVEVAYYTRTTDPYFDESYLWGELIVHEEKHRQDLYQFNTFNEPSKYYMEKRAEYFGVGDWNHFNIAIVGAKSNSQAGNFFSDRMVYDIFTSTNMREIEKLERMTLIGLEFRLNYLNSTLELPDDFSGFTKNEIADYKANRQTMINDVKIQLEFQQKYVKDNYEKD